MAFDQIEGNLHNRMYSIEKLSEIGVNRILTKGCLTKAPDGVNNLKFYEASGKLYFNFENFFQKIFFDLFEAEYFAFTTANFKQRFSDIIGNVKTIPLSKQELNKFNGIPEPSRYNSNVYDLSCDPGEI